MAPPKYLAIGRRRFDAAVQAAAERGWAVQVVSSEHLVGTGLYGRTVGLTRPDCSCPILLVEDAAPQSSMGGRRNVRRGYVCMEVSELDPFALDTLLREPPVRDLLRALAAVEKRASVILEAAG